MGADGSQISITTNWNGVEAEALTNNLEVE